MPSSRTVLSMFAGLATAYAQIGQDLKVTLNEAGCYMINGTDLALRLCEDQDAAKKPQLFDQLPFSWVNGTVTNLGPKPVCGFSFASHDIDLASSLQTIPSLTPVADQTIDLEPNKNISFAFLLPFNVTAATVPLVGIRDTLMACTNATIKTPALPAPITAYKPNVTVNATAPVDTAAAASVAAAAEKAAEKLRNTTEGVLVKSDENSNSTSSGQTVQSTSGAPPALMVGLSGLLACAAVSWFM